MEELGDKVVFSWRKEVEISLERQHFLVGRLAVEANAQQGVFPFKGEKLTRADVEWLLVRHDEGRGPVDWDDPQQRRRFGLDLRGADLCHMNLSGLPLARLRGGLTRPEWTSMTLAQRDASGVRLEGADLSEAHLEGAILRGADLSRATLRRAHLREAILYSAKLDHTYMREVDLARANLIAAHMEGAYLRDAHLERADLRHAFFDSETSLEKVRLSLPEVGCVTLADVYWGDMNLSVVDWSHVPRLGDEDKARKVTTFDGLPKGRSKLHEDYRAAVRANRQLANAMRAQGMNEQAVPYAYRAQVLQRTVLWQQTFWGSDIDGLPAQEGGAHDGRRLRLLWRRARSYESYIFSQFLDVLSGYGYKPGRSLVIYLLVIACFAMLYFWIGRLSLLESLVFSVTSFHGRGFLPAPLTSGNSVAALAALEAVMGLLIEISFIATFTQRFFGR